MTRDAMRKRRLAMGCSQTDIARIVGITPGFYAKVERGEKKPGPDNLQKLEVALGLPAAVLMGWEAQPVPTVQAHG